MKLSTFIVIVLAVAVTTGPIVTDALAMQHSKPDELNIAVEAPLSDPFEGICDPLEDVIHAFCFPSSAPGKGKGKGSKSGGGSQGKKTGYKTSKKSKPHNEDCGCFGRIITVAFLENCESDSVPVLDDCDNRFFDTCGTNDEAIGRAQYQYYYNTERIIGTLAFEENDLPGFELHYAQDVRVGPSNPYAVADVTGGTLSLNEGFILPLGFRNAGSISDFFYVYACKDAFSLCGIDPALECYVEEYVNSIH